MDSKTEVQTTPVQVNIFFSSINIFFTHILKNSNINQYLNFTKPQIHNFMELTIVSAIIAFSFIILMLVLILLFAQSKLVQSGDVNIVINGDESNPIVVPAGTTLLTTLGVQKIFLPSACGGGGTCAMCKCVILEGGGDVLPTEVGHLTRQEQKDGVRLACQVKVKQDMKIESMQLSEMFKGNWIFFIRT